VPRTHALNDERYIAIRDWDRLQNADVFKKSGGRPPWIKLYHSLLDDDGYLGLTPKRQSILIGLQMLYARKGRAIAEHTASISRALGQRVLSSDLEALNDAGFIDFLSRDALEDSLEPVAPRSRSREEGPTPSVARDAEAGNVEWSAELELARLLQAIGDVSPEDADLIRGLARRSSEATLGKLREALRAGGIQKPAAYAIKTMRNELRSRRVTPVLDPDDIPILAEPALEVSA
jgi:hypothetical protein